MQQRAKAIRENVKDTTRLVYVLENKDIKVYLLRLLNTTEVVKRAPSTKQLVRMLNSHIPEHLIQPHEFRLLIMELVDTGYIDLSNVIDVTQDTTRYRLTVKGRCAALGLL